jgi:hypothetical protein
MPVVTVRRLLCFNQVNLIGPARAAARPWELPACAALQAN